MTSIHFVVHPLPGTEDQLNDRLLMSAMLGKGGLLDLCLLPGFLVHVTMHISEEENADAYVTSQNALLGHICEELDQEMGKLKIYHRMFLNGAA